MERSKVEGREQWNELNKADKSNQEKIKKIAREIVVGDKADVIIQNYLQTLFPNEV